MKAKLNLPASSRFRGELMLILVTLLWGATFVIVKQSLDDISAMFFIALRFTIAAVLFLPLLLIKKPEYTKEAILGGIFLGALLFLGFGTQTVGLKYTTATKSGFLTGSLVVMVPFFQLLIERKIPSRGAVIGVILVFAGIMFLSSGGNSILTLLSELGSNFNKGDFLTLLCAAFFAVYVVYLDLLSSKINFYILVFCQMSVTAILAFVFMFLFDSSGIEPVKVIFSDYLIFALLYTSILATLITTMLQTKFQKSVTPTKAGIIYSFEPIFAAIYAFFLLNEKITNFGFVGSLLIFSGLIISEIYDKHFTLNGK